MASSTRRKKKRQAPVDDKDTSVRVKGIVKLLCGFCGAPQDEHEARIINGRPVASCPGGNTPFTEGRYDWQIDIVTNNIPNWKTLDVEDSRRYFDQSKYFAWGSEDDEEPVYQAAYGILLGADLEPDWIDENWRPLFELLWELQAFDPFDFTIRNITKWSEGDADWDKVDWHVQDPR